MQAVCISKTTQVQFDVFFADGITQFCFGRFYFVYGLRFLCKVCGFAPGSLFKEIEFCGQNATSACRISILCGYPVENKRRHLMFFTMALSVYRARGTHENPVTRVTDQYIRPF